MECLVKLQLIRVIEIQPFGNTLVADQLVARSVNFTETNYSDAISPMLRMRLETIDFNRRLPPRGSVPPGYTEIRGPSLPLPPLRRNIFRILAYGRPENSNRIGVISVRVVDSNGDLVETIIDNAQISNLVNGVYYSCTDYSGSVLGGPGSVSEPVTITENQELVVITDNSDLESCTLKICYTDDNSED